MPLQATSDNQENLPEFDIANDWKRLGLKYDPFVAELDETLYFPLPRWEEYLDLMQFLCHYNNVIITIIGSSSSGKTVLLNQFCKQVKDSMQVCQLMANSSLSSARLLEQLAEKFELTIDHELEWEAQLEQALLQIQNSSRICLLLIDNAHTLASEVLQMLFSFVQQQSSAQMKLHILLFGEPHLQNNLARVSEAVEQKESFIHSINIGFFSLEETEKYLEHRLMLAGFKDMPLMQAMVNRIYKLSGGAPGRINRIARRTLLNELTKRTPEKKANFIAKYQSTLLGGGGIILTLAVISLLISYLVSADENPAEVPKRVPLPVAKVPAAAIAAVSVTSTSTVPKAVPAAVKTELPSSALVSPSIVGPKAVEVKGKQAAATKSVPAKLNKAPALPRKKPAVPLNSAKEGAAYTLQLAGLSSEKAAKRFIMQHKLAYKARYYHTIRNGKDWYIIAYGQFKTLEAAKAAVAKLPAVIQDLKPWVRSYSDLKQNVSD